MPLASIYFHHRCRVLPTILRNPNPPQRRVRWTHSDSSQSRPRSDTLGVLSDNPYASNPFPRRGKRPVDHESSSPVPDDPRLQDLFDSVRTKEDGLERRIYAAQKSHKSPSAGKHQEKLASIHPDMGSFSMRREISTPDIRTQIKKATEIETVIRLWQGFKVGCRQKPMRNLREVKKAGPEPWEGDFSGSSFHSFIRAFIRFQDFENMSDVWRTLQKSGLTVNLSTWAAVLNGVAKARDWKTYEHLWHEMAASGIEATPAMWQNRMHLLVRLRKWRLAVHVLYMASDGSVYPNQPIDLVNVLLKELLYLGYNGDVREVLKWAEGEGMKMNTRSVNMFIKAAAHKHGFEAALQALEFLRQRNLQPDQATFSILLNALLRQKGSSLSASSSEREREDVSAILKELEESGLELNKYTYSIILRSLLQWGTSLQATRTILEHMQSRYVEPSLEFYTILARLYFGEEPINIAGLEELWQTMSKRGHKPDRQFCGRMIQGYATSGQIPKMMFFLQDADRRGFLPHWDILTSVINALSLANEGELLGQVMTSARNREGIFREDTMRGRKTAEAKFWSRFKELEVKHSLS